MTAWSDEQVLAATTSQLAPDLDSRLSSLLHRQQAGALHDGDRSELHGLMELYQRRPLLKAQTLCVAVDRGLQEPLQP